MKKHLLKLMGILAISASAYAIAPDQLRPPITQGTGNDGSTTEVRVTANVVTGVAVNEASPIDFGNLVRGKGVYKDQEQINERTPGVVTFRADKGDDGNQTRAKIFAALNTNMINLNWQNNNGSNGNGDNTVLKKVRITGLGLDKDPNGATPGIGMEEIPLVNGEAKRFLHAWFYAYDSNTDLAQDTYAKDDVNGNLGQKQKLGSYLGTVTVSAYTK